MRDMTAHTAFGYISKASHKMIREGMCCAVLCNIEPTPAFNIPVYLSPGPDLSDPVVVHANMLRGTIAKPTWEQIKHLYPEKFRQDEPA